MTDAVTESRRVALKVVVAVRQGELADRALARAARPLDPRDHAWVQELVYGTLRLRGRIDHILAAFVRGGLESLDPIVLDILRLGAYQLLEMGSVPPYAAVSQSVELTRAAGAGRAAGLVNAVLQAVRRDGESVSFPDPAVDPIAHLATWGSHPRWLVERWADRWGPNDTGALVRLNNERPDLYLRPVGVAPDAAIDALAGVGIAAERVPLFPDSILLRAPGGPLEALAIVPGVVQDPAAAMVVRYADIPQGSIVIDVSAAPGGKTVGLAERAELVAAADLSVGRLRRLRENATRSGVAERVAPVVADGRHPPFRAVDAVVVDAPCTGTGTFRRHPDGRWRITERDLVSLAGLQRELLGSAASLVRVGGVLVYSTCSLEPEENDWQVAAFLEENPEFRVEAPESVIDGTMLREGYLSVLPQHHGVDGAFAARMVRSR